MKIYYCATFTLDVIAFTLRLKRLVFPSNEGDMWPDQEGDEPEWVKTEREQFSSFRDKNKDGRMDAEEVKDWVMPVDYDHTGAESKHLIFESDADRVSTV